MVTLALTGLATVGMYRAYVTYSTAAEVQDQVVELQQSTRVAFHRLIREIRMAGCDETGAANAGFIQAGVNIIQFSSDFAGDGDLDDSGENIIYTVADPDGDGVNDLVRNDTNGGAGNQQVITNLDSALSLNFIYRDGNGNILTPLPLSSIDRDKIRSVEVSLVVRTTNEDYSYTNTTAYTNSQGDSMVPAQNDNFRRRQVTSRIACRNMGL